MLEEKIRFLKGVGPKKEIGFNDLGVYSIKDLLYYFPFRYEDRRNFRKIKDLEEDRFCLIKGKVLVRNFKKIPYFVRSRKVRSIFDVVLSDGSGEVACVWFNQGYLVDVIKVNQELIIYGKPTPEDKRFKFNSPEYELIKEEDSLNMGRIIGTYRLSSDFTQKFMRKIIASALESSRGKIPEALPFYIRKEKNIFNIVKSLDQIHFPTSWQEAENARERFIFEELFYSQILVYLRKAKHRSQKGIPLVAKAAVLDRIRNNLAFTLTSSQKSILNQILDDLKKPCPMHRLLQGDVGCGKTIVAAFAIAVCADCKRQVAFMVPTEVLAYQHKETLEKIFKGLDFNIEVITSSLPKKTIEDIYKGLNEGKIDIIVGTHALIQGEVKFKKLGLVVIDEQHKFGVAQRALLPKKGLRNPHCLIMSATPIPRSLALSLYGDLDLSIIKEMPKGRMPPRTMCEENKQRKRVYKFLRERLSEGRQIFIIYPVIEESQIQDLKSLEVMFDSISKEFSEFNVGMFHGKMSTKEKAKAIKKFREKRIDILVSTTVVEVGVDIENATTMVVENPERFGLSQLHQLRGRIQRSNHQPYFILLSKSNLSESASKRLQVISSTTDGFKIAEEDLKLRGPGDFFGNLQHGLPKLKIANPLRDLEVLNEARSFAYNVIKNDPYLEKSMHRCIREHLHFWLKEISQEQEELIFRK